MKVKCKTILLAYLLLFMLTVPATGWQCPGNPPGSCYVCQDGVWVHIGNCWYCPPCGYGCVNCWCTWIGVTGSLTADYAAPVGCDVPFTLWLTTGVCGDDCITWSGGGEPATQEGGSMFVTHWDTIGTKTVTASCCGASFSKQVIVFDLDLIADGVSEEQEEDPGKYIRVNDDLVAINPSITPALNSGSAMLVAFWDGDYCPIKIWLNPTKGSELTLYQGMEGTGYVSWDLSQVTLPAALYVEGCRAGDVTLYFCYDTVAWYDIVVFHVVDCVSSSDCDPSLCQVCSGGTCVPETCGPDLSKPDTEHPSKATGGEPIALKTGEFQFATRDFLIPGRVLPIEIVRTYKNQGEYNSPFGYGWDLNYNMKVTKFPSSDELVLSNGRGSVLEYHRVPTNPNKYVSPEGYFNYILENTDGSCVLFEKYGDIKYFDSGGKLAEIQDRTGNNSITLTYDTAGRLATITNDTLWRQITFSYYSDRWTITDFAGRTWVYRYGPDNDLHTVTDPGGLVTTYNYSSHNLVSVTDPSGQTWLENFYTNDKVNTQRYGSSGDVFQFTYNPGSHQTTTTDRRNVNTVTVYNDVGLALSEKVYTFNNPKLRTDDPDFYLTCYEYDSSMNMTRQIMPRGNCISYIYDANNANGNVTAATMEPNNGVDPNITMHFTYNAKFNFVQTATDARGNTTTYDYNDITGNLESITYPEVNVVDINGAVVKASPIITFTYNNYGQIKTMTAPDRVVTKYEYDDGNLADPNYGRLKRIIVDYNATDGLNITTEYKYDVLGNVIETSDPCDNVTKFAYNVIDKLTKITDPRGYVTNFYYNNSKLLNRVERQIEGPNQITSFTYDILDHVKEVTDPLGYVTKYSCDKNENRSDVNDAEKNNTHYEYDERNLLWKVTDANSDVTTFSYTLNGKLARIEDANGSETGYHYDGFDRLLWIQYPNDTNEVFTYDKSSNVTSRRNRKGETIYYEYDALNRLTVKKRPAEPNIIFSYDVSGRLVDVNDPRTITNGGGMTRYKYDRIGRIIEVNDIEKRIVKYGYNNLGLRTKLTYPDGSCITYEYDALGRLVRIKDDASNTLAEYSYDDLDRRTLLTLGNGSNIVYEYDIGNRLKRLTNNIGAETIDFQYSDYDKVGNRLSCKINSAATQVYDYDNLYQLTYVDYNNGSSAGYYYDKLGNRQKVINGGTTVYNANSLNQYTKVSATSYSYDNNGNLTYDGTRYYIYDCENRLTTSTGLTRSYRYDFAGRRVRKIQGIAGPAYTKYCYDGDQIIAHYNNSGTLVRKFIYGPGIDEPIMMIVSAGQPNAGKYYYHYDGLGSVAALSNVNSEVVERYSYTVFGEPNRTSSVGNPYLFTGREYDSETGNYYYRARYYSPKIGRFLQTDPIGYYGGINLYAYCGNNPLNFVDPLGLCPEPSTPLPPIMAGCDPRFIPPVRPGPHIPPWGPTPLPPFGEPPGYDPFRYPWDEIPSLDPTGPTYPTFPDGTPPTPPIRNTPPVSPSPRVISPIHRLPSRFPGPFIIIPRFFLEPIFPELFPISSGGTEPLIG